LVVDMRHRTIKILLATGLALIALTAIAACVRRPRAEPAGTSTGITVGEAPTVHGVPAGFEPVTDARALAAQEPHVANMPTTGQPIAYVRRDRGSSQVWRIVVVLSQDSMPVLAGSAVTLPKDWPGQGHQLVSDDGHTLYVISLPPSGRRWFLAVTGGGNADRFAAARDIVAFTLNGP
jgi:hypothetical protein